MSLNKPRMDFTATQQRAYDLYYNASQNVIDGKCEPFYHGRIPVIENYKRLNLSRQKAIAIASYGYITAKLELGVDLYFTQALIVGVSVLGTHHNILTVLPSQYGKSFVAACVALLQASKGEPVSIGANDGEITEKILSEIHLIEKRLPESFKSQITSNSILFLTFLNSCLHIPFYFTRAGVNIFLKT